MPRKKRKGGGGGGLFCGCFGVRDEIPQIQLEIGNHGLRSPTMMEPALPMPLETEVNVKFAELVVSNVYEHLYLFLNMVMCNLYYSGMVNTYSE